MAGRDIYAVEDKIISDPFENLNIRHMKKINLILFTFCLFISLDAQNITGIWKAIDDVDGQPSSHIEIYDDGGEVKGKIVKLYDDPDDTLCDKCKGDKRDKPVLGMEIIWDMKRKGEQWAGGKIMDPENGKSYKCKMKVTEDGTLKVRGFIGIFLIGRTQTWYRVE